MINTEIFPEIIPVPLYVINRSTKLRVGFLRMYLYIFSVLEATFVHE